MQPIFVRSAERLKRPKLQKVNVALSLSILCLVLQVAFGCWTYLNTVTYSRLLSPEIPCKPVFSKGGVMLDLGCSWTLLTGAPTNIFK